MIETLKDLEKLLKLCRKQGVTDIKLGPIEFKLGELPTVISSNNVDSREDKYADFPDGMLSDQQLMFYSSGGAPEDDPEIEGATQ